MSARIQLCQAKAEYQGKVVLHDIDLTIQPGEKVALVGHSGAGKSTLLRLLYEHHPNNTALVPQELGLVQSLSVFHNVYMGRLACHPTWYNLLNLVNPFKTEIAQVQAILARMQLEDSLFNPVNTLSGGQRQRTAVARCLFQGGDLLLADEPVSAVDEYQSRRILDILSQSFPTWVIALHDVGFALDYCDRIIGLQDGRIVFDRQRSELDATQLMPLYNHD